MQGLVLKQFLKCASFSFTKLLGITKSKVDAKLDSFLSSASAQYIEAMYNIWLKDPSKVHPSWDAYFRLSKDGGVGYVSPPTLGRTRMDMPMSRLKRMPTVSRPHRGTATATAPAPAASTATESDIEKHLAVQAVIRGYQVRGHLIAKIDPLERPTRYVRTNRSGTIIPDLISSFNLAQSDLDKSFKLPRATRIGGQEKSLPLKEIINRLETSYCQSIGLEYMYIPCMEECDWIRERFEPPGITKITNDKKKLCLARLARAQLFENFCARKYPSEKRFGLEGLESAIPCLKTIIDRSSELGVEMFVIGMAHRGRLNVLVNVCRKSLVEMFAQFEGLKPEDEGSGDIKYHLGLFVQKMNRVTNKNIKIVVLANPSHLEVVNPVAVGRVRAEQFFAGDTAEGKKCLGILLHGDAAFTGQGVNFEVINIASLPCYNTHGTIHIVTNNQIGFTTDRKVAGSSPYCTDVGRVINSPVIHVNADEPDSVVYVSETAADWRHKFRRDIVIDLMGYRRHGHQEVDDPFFTQPILYNKIKKVKPVFEKYAEKMINEKIVTAAELKQIKDEYEKILERDFVKAKEKKGFKMKDWLDAPWSAFFEGKDPNKMIFPLGVPEDTIKHITKAISSPPPDSAKFVIHKALQRILNNRKDLAEKRLVDFSMAEAVAYGSLLKQGVHVRITGEDVERGTFNHRHHVYHHQTVENETYSPMKNLYRDQAKYTICNSCLSEYSIMGFEHGYSMTNPHTLIMWEAQYGDFSNTAQPVIDQYLSSGESKWGRQCGMVCLLPHGLEGQGPDHSSVRPERLTDMICEDADTPPPKDTKNYALEQLRAINWIVVNNSVASNHFHAFRRQVALPFRKVLIILSPKGILRLPETRSSFDLLLEGTEYQRLIPDAGPASKSPDSVKKLIFCTGKVYYDAAKAVKAKKLESEIAVSRIEQIGPFPFDLVKEELAKYPKAQVCWLQEEHKNQGFWDHVEPRIRNVLHRWLNDSREVSYIGRAVSASPATGSKYLFQAQYKKILEDITNMDNAKGNPNAVVYANPEDKGCPC